MLQNVKVDIIYYMTPTDFEMEFNLCGCCRMRLLTDKTNDRKSLVHALSRAVSRSRVILCAGPLFSDTGLINSVALAIGRPLERVDNARYGIVGNGEISVIKGALPLVTAEGVFGGCIIESGPQSIVLLSESKGIRKSLMTALIHPYIEEISLLAAGTGRPQPTAPEPAAEAGAENAELPDAPLTPAGDEPIPAEEPSAAAEEAASEAPEPEIQPESEQETEPENVGDGSPLPESPSDTANDGDASASAADDTNETETAETNSDSDTDNENTDDQADIGQTDDTEADRNSAPDEVPKMRIVMDDPPEELPLYIEPQRVKYSKKNYYDTAYGDSTEASQFCIPEEFPAPARRSLRVPVLILSVVLLLALIVLAYVLIFVPMREGYSIGEYFRQLFEPAAVSLRQMLL